MNTHAAAPESANWAPEVEARLSEVNFMLAMQGLGAVLRRCGEGQASREDLLRAYVTALIATEVAAEMRGETMDEARLAIFSEGLDEHGGSGSIVLLLPSRGDSGSFWRHEIRIARASLRLDPTLPLNPPEIAHTLVHGDQKVAIEV
jgi:hypothetical protein